MDLYNEAVNVVTEAQQRRLQKLIAEAENARDSNVLLTKEAILELVPISHPLRPVTRYVADTLRIGGDYEYPLRKVSLKAGQLFRAVVCTLDDVPKALEALVTKAGGVDLDILARDAGAADLEAWERVDRLKKAIASNPLS